MAGHWGGAYGDMPPLVDSSRIPPPPNARFEAGGLDLGAFPGHPDAGRQMYGSGTPYPRTGPSVLPPPHSAPGAFYNPNLPMPSPWGGGWSAPSWHHGAGPPDNSYPVTPGGGYPPQRDDGFASLAWRPPEYDRQSLHEYERGPPPGSAPPGGYANDFYTNPDPPPSGGVPPGGFFAQAGRPASAPRHGHARSASRHEDPWSFENSSAAAGAWGLEHPEDEVDDFRHARQHLMQGMDRGHQQVAPLGPPEDTDWDLLDSFDQLGIAEHERGRSHSRHRPENPIPCFHRQREPLQPLPPSRALDAQHLYTAEDRISRPRDWRADYSVKSGLLNRWSSIRHRSDVVEMSDPVKRVPNLLLFRVSSSRPPLFVDLRFPLQTQLERNSHPSSPMPVFPVLNRPPTSIDFTQMACEPAAPHMRLYHPRIPWYIDVVSASAQAGRGGVGVGVVGLTVWEVIEGVWRELQRPISARDFYNEEMAGVVGGGRGRSMSMSMSMGMGSPYHPDIPLQQQSPCMGMGGGCAGMAGWEGWGCEEGRLVGHGGEWVWTGIVRKNGMWEIKTTRV
ncbi:hypothetical protein BDP27DRAFT_1320936 [Rhodocollybia butyracea]|uniref:DUF6699 domain-containing protein n=1 Tax=Rhodocollybia butyracea TaxID=206335 RepID=A0A9P5Q0U5_9AGAR|nr:hypothetical protein BDP27DRAFT_1320936 [Rhodocollybia butyracea]